MGIRVLAICELFWHLYLLKFAPDYLESGRLRTQRLVEGRAEDITRHGSRSRGTMTMATMIVVATGPAKRSRCRQFQSAFFASLEAIEAAGI